MSTKVDKRRLVAAVLIMTVLTGCGGKKDSASGSNGGSAANQTQTETQTTTEVSAETTTDSAAAHFSGVIL
jgi:hypothetical protein